MLKDIREDFALIGDIGTCEDDKYSCSGTIYQLGTGSYKLLDLHKGQEVLFTSQHAIKVTQEEAVFFLVRKDAILAVLEPTNG
jgi:co-chaperonin GroES (HSP10)